MAAEDTETAVNCVVALPLMLRSIAALTEHRYFHTLDCGAMRLEA